MLFSENHARPASTTDYRALPHQRYIDGGGNYLDGTYGVVGGTDTFDEDTDGKRNESAVDFRCTITLHTTEWRTELAMGGDGEKYDVAGYDSMSNDQNANRYSELRELGGQGHLPAIIEKAIRT